MKKNYAFLFLIPLIAILAFSIPVHSPITVETFDNIQVNINAKIYNINGNAQLNASSSSGNGTYDNPFIIEDLVVTAPLATDFAIYIENTSQYFILRNCTASGGSQAFTLDNVIYGRVENCTAKTSKYGILLKSCDYSTFENNTITRNVQYGIYLDIYSNGNSIEWNRIWYNFIPIYKESSCPCNLIQNNEIKHLISLTEGEVTPISGDTSTIFVYTVNYSHVDDTAPQYIRVVIDGSNFYNMTKQNSSDNTYSDGCIYTYNTSHPLGQHTYHFEAGDGIYTARNPTSGESIGPKITLSIPGYPIILTILSLITIVSLITLNKIQKVK